MKFIEKGHSYITDSGEEYTSVTGLIKQYEKKKDWQEIAEKYAKKHKKDVEQVQAEWREEGRKAIEKGVNYHNKMESEYVARGSVTIGEKVYEVIPSPMEDGVKVAIPLKLSDGIYPEIIVYSDKYKVSGQADLVEVLDGVINIKDYKTSKEIKTESYKHWKTGHEMLLPPLGHLMNCNFVTYALQLNIYMYLLKSHNRKLKIGDMIIHHIKIDEDKVDLIPYLVPNLQKEARVLLEHHYEVLKYAF